MLPKGPRGENATQAIAACNAALRVFNANDFPFAWALAEDALGDSYAELSTGDRAENARQALAAYRAGLIVLTEKEFPYEWAYT
jgi:hypothetical protein